LQPYELPQVFDSHPQDTGYSNTGLSSKDWQNLLSNLDSGHNNIYDGIYGGPGAPASLVDYNSSSPEQSQISNFPKAPIVAESTSHQSLWSADEAWNMTNYVNSSVNIPTSVLSFSSDETPSLDDLGDLGFPAHLGDGAYGKSIVIPGDGTPPIGLTSEAGWISGLDPLFNG